MRRTKTIALFIICSVTFLKGYGQDIIFFKDGTKDSVKILKISIEVISYKKYRRLNGPIYTVSKKRVLLIEFEDGGIEVFGTEVKSLPGFNEIVYPSLKRRNIFTVNLIPIIITNIHLSYERINSTGNIGHKYHATASLEPYASLGLYALGFDLNYYYNKQKRVSYFVGPAFRGGVLDSRNIFGSVLFNAGLAYTSRKKFYLGTQAAIGPGLAEGFGIIPYFFFMLNIGGRF